ncbi:hypothetical protein BASA81_003034 [Batrachochytrium salamandrivorans]|nr:hypothetical protein BASA81_003034 [Batrachochytrium salamandrivorans]
MLLLLLLGASVVYAVALVPGLVQNHGLPNLVSAHHGWQQVNLTAQYEFGLPPPPFSDRHLEPNATIVVLISSLRETRLASTLVSLFTKAKHPSRVFAAVVQQNAPEDEDVLVEYCREMLLINHTECLYEANIRITRLLHTEAKGPVYARALGNHLVDFDRDEFCMQIDAHTLVVQDWDSLLLEDWGKAENEFAILTTYPANSVDLGRNGNGMWTMPHLCCVNFDHVGILTNCQAKAAANLQRPLLSPLWAAGFSLSKCHAERLVPNDIKLVGVFAGEEYARGVRLWTHGYDFYSNTRPWIATYYGKDKGGKEFNWDDSNLKQSKLRMQTLLRMPHSDQSASAIHALLGADLGPNRTLQQYIDFTGINPHVGEKHTRSQSRCAPVYVPWYVPPATTAASRFLRHGSSTFVEAEWLKWLLVPCCVLFLGLGFRLLLLESQKRRRRRD